MDGMYSLPERAARRRAPAAMTRRRASPKRGNGAPGTRETTCEKVGGVTDADILCESAIARRTDNWNAGLDVARGAP
jgi:hypothetical protein